MAQNYQEILTFGEFQQLHRKYEKIPRHLDAIIAYRQSLDRENGSDAEIQQKADRVAETIKNFVNKMKLKKEQ